MKRTILIGAVLAVVATAAFAYVPRAVVAPEAVSITATTSETAIETMRAAASSGVLTFAGRDYPGMGFFVDAINGVKNAGGKYWILYINGVSATAGVSAARVRTGDVIEWKYEKSY